MASSMPGRECFGCQFASANSLLLSLSLLILGIKTTAVADGDDYIINGSKVFISNGQMSDAVIVVARTDTEAKPAHGLSLFLVDSK